MNNNTKNILKKELRRTFRDKKSLLMMLLVPVIIPAFIIGMAAFYNMMGNKNPEEYNKIGFAYELTEEEKRKFELQKQDRAKALVKDFYEVQKFDKISEDEEGNSVWKFEVPQDYEDRNKVIKLKEEV